MTDIEKLATQLEELNRNLKTLIDRLPPVGLASGWTIYHQHSYPHASPHTGPGYWPQQWEITSGARG